MNVEHLSYYTLALPDDLTLWTVPAQGIWRWDEEALVYDVGYGGTVLRHYAFYHRWYAVNCTLDRDGQFVTEKGTIDWCFNIDIGTPLFTRNSAAYDVDLCLDVLVGTDGKEHIVKDEDEFEHAVEQGWLTAQEQAGAQHGLKELLNLIHSGALIDFLHAICPFHSMEYVLDQPPARKVPLEQVSLRTSKIAISTSASIFRKSRPEPIKSEDAGLAEQYRIDAVAPGQKVFLPRRTQESRRRAMTEEYVDVGGVRLWTLRHGTGLPIILCSGGPGCCDYLEPVAAMMDDLAQVYRWEQRGCGRSDKTGPYDQATYIADLEALRRHFGHERWIVGGHSWGANLALAYACEHPERVLGLIYLSGTGITEDWIPEYRRAREQRQEQLPDFAYPHNQEVNTEGNRSRTEYLQSPGLPDRVRALHVPVLMIQGEYDLRPNWPAQELAALLPQAQLEIIPQAEHCLWLTHPKPLCSSLRAFVQQQSTSSLEAIPHFLRLSDRIGTAGQPSAEQFAAIQEAGYEIVVNLRPPADTLPNERDLVKASGMAYVSIPVIWDAPRVEDVEQFVATMQSNEDKRVFVHCAMNMRVSAFMYLYRVAKQQVTPDVAAHDLHRIWEPNPTWQHLIEQVLEQQG